MPPALDLELNVTCWADAPPSDDRIVKVNVTNVRFGLPAGPHTFRGEWWASGELSVVRETTIEFVG